MKYILFTLLFSISLSAQGIDLEKDTIQMNNVVVNGKKSNPRHTSYKFRHGICTYHSGLSGDNEIATMAYDMPKGILKTLRFEFNNSASRKDKGKFVDTQIELNLYDAKPDGNPGEKLASKIFMVAGTHSGKMDIDVSDLSVKNENGIYIGLRKIYKESAKMSDFEVDCGCKENEDHRTMVYSPKRKKWLLSHGPYAFELTVTIEK